MITYLESSLFESPAQTLVNTVNTYGVMGRGIAREFKCLYPEMFEAYAAKCKDRMLQPGRLHMYRTVNKWVLNFPTKTNHKWSSRIEYVEAGLKTFVRTYSAAGVSSISFPQLGCGTGGLDWNRDVLPLMEEYLSRLEIEIFIHVYSGAASASRSLESLIQRLRYSPAPIEFEQFSADLLEITRHRGNPTLELDIVRLMHHSLVRKGYFGFTECEGDAKEQFAEMQDLVVQLPYVVKSRCCQSVQATKNRSKYVASEKETWDSAVQFDGSVLRPTWMDSSGFPEEDILWTSNPMQTSFMET